MNPHESSKTLVLSPNTNSLFITPPPYRKVYNPEFIRRYHNKSSSNINLDFQSTPHSVYSNSPNINVTSFLIYNLVVSFNLHLMLVHPSVMLLPLSLMLVTLHLMLLANHPFQKPLNITMAMHLVLDCQFV